MSLPTHVTLRFLVPFHLPPRQRAAGEPEEQQPTHRTSPRRPRRNTIGSDRDTTTTTSTTTTPEDAPPPVSASPRSPSPCRQEIHPPLQTQRSEKFYAQRRATVEETMLAFLKQNDLIREPEERLAFVREHRLRLLQRRRRRCYSAKRSHERIATVRTDVYLEPHRMLSSYLLQKKDILEFVPLTSSHASPFADFYWRTVIPSYQLCKTLQRQNEGRNDDKNDDEEQTMHVHKAVQELCFRFIDCDNAKITKNLALTNRKTKQRRKDLFSLSTISNEPRDEANVDEWQWHYFFSSLRQPQNANEQHSSSFSICAELIQKRKPTLSSSSSSSSASSSPIILLHCDDYDEEEMSNFDESKKEENNANYNNEYTKLRNKDKLFRNRVRILLEADRRFLTLIHSSNVTIREVLLLLLNNASDKRDNEGGEKENDTEVTQTINLKENDQKGLHFGLFLASALSSKYIGVAAEEANQDDDDEEQELIRKALQVGRKDKEVEKRVEKEAWKRNLRRRSVMVLNDDDIQLGKDRESKGEWPMVTMKTSQTDTGEEQEEERGDSFCWETEEEEEKGGDGEADDDIYGEEACPLNTSIASLQLKQTDILVFRQRPMDERFSLGPLPTETYTSSPLSTITSSSLSFLRHQQNNRLYDEEETRTYDSVIAKPQNKTRLLVLHSSRKIFRYFHFRSNETIRQVKLTICKHFQQKEPQNKNNNPSDRKDESRESEKEEQNANSEFIAENYGLFLPISDNNEDGEVLDDEDENEYKEGKWLEDEEMTLADYLQPSNRENSIHNEVVIWRRREQRKRMMLLEGVESTVMVRCNGIRKIFVFDKTITIAAAMRFLLQAFELLSSSSSTSSNDDIQNKEDKEKKEESNEEQERAPQKEEGGKRNWLSGLLKDLRLDVTGSGHIQKRPSLNDHEEPNNNYGDSSPIENKQDSKKQNKNEEPGNGEERNFVLFLRRNNEETDENIFSSVLWPLHYDEEQQKTLWSCFEQTNTEPFSCWLELRSRASSSLEEDFDETSFRLLAQQQFNLLALPFQPRLLAGEVVEEVCDNVTCMMLNGASASLQSAAAAAERTNGRLFVTNYKLVFMSYNRSTYRDLVDAISTDISIPLCSINKVRLKFGEMSMWCFAQLYCKNLRTILFQLPNQRRRVTPTSISSLCSSPSLNQHPSAYSSSPRSSFFPASPSSSSTFDATKQNQSFVFPIASPSSVSSLTVESVDELNEMEEVGDAAEEHEDEEEPEDEEQEHEEPEDILENKPSSSSTTKEGRLWQWLRKHSTEGEKDISAPPSSSEPRRSKSDTFLKDVPTRENQKVVAAKENEQKVRLRQQPTIVQRIVKRAFPSRMEELFAFSNQETFLQEEDGWNIYSPIEEYKRLQLIPSRNWRITKLNINYELCETYPSLIVVPAAVSDQELQAVAAFRAKRRVPAVVWKHATNGATITRCSQPHVGAGMMMVHRPFALVGNKSRCTEDEKYIQVLRMLTPQTQRLYLLDSRPIVNAVANSFIKGGSERTEIYRGCEMKYLGIGNIRVMNESYRRLKEICQIQFNLSFPGGNVSAHLGPSASSASFSSSNASVSSSFGSTSSSSSPASSSSSSSPSSSSNASNNYGNSNFLSLLESTRWLDNVSLILSSALTIVELIDKAGVSIVTHCTDGWDRTSQLTALAQLLLDPFYRTIRGFEILIEKEWISFGHQFNVRTGHTAKKKRESSPIFLLFIDSVWQVMQQFPSSFEFNERFLITLLDHLYSCRFGTFLANCEKEKKFIYDLEHTTKSLWSYMNAPKRRKRFLNYYYHFKHHHRHHRHHSSSASKNKHNKREGEEEEEQRVLYPVVKVKKLKLWTNYYMRWVKEMKEEDTHAWMREAVVRLEEEQQRNEAAEEKKKNMAHRE